VVLVVAAFLLARASGIDTLLLLKVAGGAGVAIGALLLAGRIISGMRAAPTVASKRREESLPGPDKIPSSEEARRIGPSYETASAANPSDTEMMITQATHPYSEHALPSTVLIREPSAMAWLLILNGPQRGRQFRLADTFTIGRGSHCDVVLDDSGVSRAHAEVFLKNNRFHVYDLGSANGLFVNGIQAVEQELRDRDEIRIGNTTLMFIQAVSPEDLTVEAKRRVREFDSVWDELTKSVRHE
jgi:hypothetical protein